MCGTVVTPKKMKIYRDDRNSGKRHACMVKTMQFFEGRNIEFKNAQKAWEDNHPEDIFPKPKDFNKHKELTEFAKKYPECTGHTPAIDCISDMYHCHIDFPLHGITNVVSVRVMCVGFFTVFALTSHSTCKSPSPPLRVHRETNF